MLVWYKRYAKLLQFVCLLTSLATTILIVVGALWWALFASLPAALGALGSMAINRDLDRRFEEIKARK